MRRSIAFLASAAVAAGILTGGRPPGERLEWSGLTGSPAEELADRRSAPSASRADAAALDEMLKGSKGKQQRWTRPPALTVVTTVLEYQQGDTTQYAATTETMPVEAADELVGDLTDALAVLTDNAFTGFASVRQEAVPAGRSIDVSRAGQIVVARYRGVRSLLDTIGFGGRSARSDGVITRGAIVLDNDFDRSSQLRRLLRTHELGHALGYNHVTSTTSIMNPRIGSELTDFDRQAARLAFQPAPGISAFRR